MNITRRGLLCGTATLLAVTPSLSPVWAAPSLKIGIIGAGRIGGTLAKLWAQAGYKVMISARSLEEMQKLAGEIGHGVTAGTPLAWRYCPSTARTSCAYGPLDGFERVLDSAGIPRGALPEAPDPHVHH